MAKDQEEINLPGENSDNRKTSLDLLPKYFRTNTNKKFLSATLDPLIQDGVIEKINGYLGRKTTKSFSTSDNYIPDISADRQHYQLEPALVVKDNNENVTYYKDYNDYINQIKAFGGLTNNHSRINAQEYYSWDPRVDWDKLVNYREYYWVSQGPVSISIAGQEKGITSTYGVSIVNDGDNNAFVFNPDGLTRNPTIKLYRGQTYKFEVNQKNNPFWIKVKKTKTGFEYNENVENNGAQVGTVTITIDQNTPDILHYVNTNDLSAAGVIQVLSIEENTKIDVEKEIVGKKDYQLKSGHYLSTGMKVNFLGDVTPEKYAKGNWYVEGVGKEIILVSEQELETLYPGQSQIELQFDDIAFDISPFDQNSEKSKDYITINRAAYDGNHWSRANRWFHKDVILQSYEISGIPPVIDQASRATRPIIEFIPGIRLYNNGWNRAGDVDLVDTVTTDIMSDIEGTTGYYVDNINLVEGMRVIFTADNDLLIRDKVFTVNFVRFNNERIITLVPDETENSIGDTIVVKSGKNNQGKQFWFNGSNWTEAQQKTSTNQTPLFDLFDANGNSLSTAEIYGSTSFSGNKVFSYQEGTGTNDTVLGFPLKYLSISNIGDILFSCNVLTDTYEYTINENKYSITAKDAYLKVYNRHGSFGYHSAWERAAENSSQPVIRHYIADLTRNDFEIDTYNDAALLDDLDVKVFVNNKLNNDYTLVTNASRLYVRFNTDLNENDGVIIKTKTLASKNENGYYEFPLNLQNNPQNENPVTITLGEITDHVESIFNALPNVTGSFPGTTNLRDLGTVSSYGSRFVKHSGPVNIAMYHVTNKDTNIIKAMDYAAKSYDQFQKTFLDSITNNDITGSPRVDVDNILEEITSSKKETDSFYNSGMVPFRAFNEITHTVIDPTFELYGITEIYEPYKHQDKALLVYLNDKILLLGSEYTFIDDNFVQILVPKTVGDTITIREYSTIVGNYIPPTPAKLGLLPKYEPKKYLDTTLQTPVNVIQGHDGSVIRAFDDYRDDLIVELERRIFNNIKIEYTNDLINFYDVNPGAYRTTEYSSEDSAYILRPKFLKWHKNLNVSYTDNTWYDSENPFTYNYSSGNFEGTTLPGFWRGMYQYWFDTDRPHLTPWEMLGFSIMPTWWEDTYGPAPYTSENLILWRDLEEGRIKEPGNERVNNNFTRPGLTDIIPVDQNGNLKDPIACNLAQNYQTSMFSDTFKFGDVAPVENAWRRSSTYRFSLLTAWILENPAQVFGVYLDRAHTARDVSGIIKYVGEYPTLAGLADKVSNTALASGLITYINNWLYQTGSSFVDEYIFNLENADNQLGAKLAGYTEKSKFKLILDSRTPLNEGNVFVPEENYNIIVNTSSPVEVLSYSGIIVEKRTNGFLIRGYDQKFPFFTYRPIITSQTDNQITIGSVSESFISWDRNKIYIQGKIVEYNGSYYRCREDHTSGDTFESERFVQLPSLPTVGGNTYFHRSKFDTSKYYTMNYGTILPTVQDVVDFIYGYSEYLTESGFVFENYDNENGILQDWETSVKEFVFWTTQNWAEGTVISVSPGAKTFSVNVDYTNVDSLLNDFYDYEIYNSSGTRISINDLDVTRANNKFTIESLQDEGIYFARLHLVQTEHVLLLDNTTVFADTLYDKPAGYRQERVKVLGYKTVLWDGGLTTPGFVFDEINVKTWTPFTKYQVGDVIKHKEYYYSANEKVISGEVFEPSNWKRLDGLQKSSLLPNFDYRAEQFTDFFDLDTDNFDTEQQRLAQHTIGYQKRRYLENIINDDVSQYKFYQGMILDKGTKNVLSKMFDKLSAADKESLEFYEEWAVRVGDYGAVDSFVEVEYKIDENLVRLEPQPFELVSTIDPNATDLVYRYTPGETYVTYDGYDHKPFKATTKIPSFIRTAGNVDESDVDFNVKHVEDIAALNIDDFDVGSTVWVSFYDASWTVLRMQDSKSRVLSASAGSGNDVILKTSEIVSLEPGDVIGVKNVSEEVDKLYKVKSVNSYEITLENDTKLSDGVTVEDSSQGILYTFVPARISDVSEINSITPADGFREGELVWVDGVDNNWKVLEKNKVYNKTVLENTTTSVGGFGAAVATDRYNRDFIVGDDAANKVYVYARPNDLTDHRLIQTIDLPEDLDDVVGNVNLFNDFASVISLSPDTKFMAVGAPTASSIPSFFTGEWNAGTTYSREDTVSYNGKFYQALEAGLNSTPPDLVAAWNELGYNVIDGKSTSDAGLDNQGWVGVYVRTGSGNFNNLFNMQAPEIQAGQQFGKHISIKQVGELDYRMFVSAPGHDSKGKVFVFEWNVGTGGKWVWVPSKTLPLTADGDKDVEITNLSMDFGADLDVSDNGNILTINAPYANNVYLENFKGEYINTVAYSINEVVSYNGGFWKKTSTSSAGTTPAVGVNWEEQLPDTSGVYGKVFVYKYENNAYSLVQTINESTLGNTTTVGDAFGYSISITEDGQTLAVGSPKYDSGNKLDTGKVLILANQETVASGNANFVVSQTIEVRATQNQEFGNTVSISGDNLVIGSRRGDQVERSPLSDGTTFDSDATYISNVYKDTGKIDVYHRYDGQYTYEDSIVLADRDVVNLGTNVVANRNHVVAGVPNYNNRTGAVVDFYRTNNVTSWNTHRAAVAPADVSKIKSAFLYNTRTNTLIKELDIIDPLQGKIAGPAEQEIKYKTFWDPAVYTVGDDTVNVDEVGAWDASRIGEVWWDLSTARFVNYHQNSALYRANNWSKLNEYGDIDVYEWVSSKYPPAVWDELSATEDGPALGITGQTKYGSAVYSVGREYDPVAKIFVTKYMYWVKNKNTLPQAEGRALNVEAIANLIKDPKGQGYSYIAITSNNSFVLYNSKQYLNDTDVAVNIRFWTTEDTNKNIHRQYQIISEGLDISNPNEELVKKWFDSLVGFTKEGYIVPNPNLGEKQRYGILNKPRQGMFKNNHEAMKQVVEYANFVFSKNILVDDFDLSPLFDKEEQPDLVSKLYDLEISDDLELNFIATGKLTTAELSLRIEDGKVVDVIIENEGRGYLQAPLIKVVGQGSGAELSATIDSFGRIASVNIVNAGQGYLDDTYATVRQYTVLSTNVENTGKWGLYIYDSRNTKWQLSRIQSYDVTNYWNYKDWYADGITVNTPIDYLIDGSFQLADINPRQGQLVKITNIGSSGTWLLLQRNNENSETDTNLNYNVVGRQNATIELSSALYDFDTNVLGYDGISYEEVNYDSIPTQESRAILEAIKNNIFIDNLLVEFNNLFFNSVRYVLTEQTPVDWIFKTSFVKAKHNVGQLEQRATYKNDSLTSYEDYINEVKPYKTKVREFISSYVNTEVVPALTTDFDLKPNNNIKVINNDLVLDGNTTLDIYPDKSWKDNHTFGISAVEIQTEGLGYQTAPEITFEGGGGSGAAATAFIGRGGAITNVVVTNPGSGYYSRPKVIINGSVDDAGQDAVLVAIIDNNTVRKNDITVKFDRITGLNEVTTLDVTETFVGTGVQTQFSLKWPVDLRKGNTVVTINGEELLESEFVLGNATTTNNDVSVAFGHLELLIAPEVTESLVIQYKKDISYLTAADRIKYYYAPTIGSKANDLSALMDGVDYGGVNVTGFGFEPSGGWGTDGTTWDNVTWEGADEGYTDITIYNDGSELTYTFDVAPATGENWNVYVNGVRIDDENFGTANPVNNSNAVMQTIIGDDVTATITIPVQDVSAVILGTEPQKQIIIRSTSSDGSYIPVGVDIDSVVNGGDLGYAQATGYNPEDITMDGDGFVTPDNSRGLEEQLPGHVSEAVDMFVYSLSRSGGPQINSISYVADGSTKSFAYIADPQSKDALIVKVNNKILRPTDYKYTPNFAAYSDFLGAYESNIVIKQTRVAEIDTRLAEIVGLVTPLESSETQLEQDIIDQQNVVNNASNNLTYYLSQISVINSQIASLNPTSPTYAQQLAALQAQLQATELQRDVWQQTFDDETDELTTLQDSLTQVQDQLAVYAVETADLEDEKDVLETEIADLEVNIQSLNDYLINPGKTIILDETPQKDDVVTILTFGTNGNDIILIDEFSGDGSTSEFITPLKFTKNLRVFATVNGSRYSPRLFATDDSYEESNRLGLDFDPTPPTNADVKYTVYNAESPDYSYIQKQIITTDGSTTQFDLDVTPYGATPSANFVVVFAGDKMLNGGYTQVYTATDAVSYQVDLSDFDYGGFSADHTEVYVDGDIKELGVDYQIDFGNNEIQFIPGKVKSGQEIKIFIMTNAEYYVMNGKLVTPTPLASGTNLMIMTFYNTDVFDTEHRSKSVLSRRVLTPDSKWYRSSVAANSGIILLDTPVSNANYVLVAINGNLLTPNRDYRLVENGTAIQVDIARNINSTDQFSIVIFDYDPVERSFAFRQFTDNLNRTHYKAVNSNKSTKLVSELNWYDSSIDVEDASVLDDPIPRQNVPGIVFIGSERIEYMQKTGNVLSQLRRGTYGTATKESYGLGTEVLNQGKSLTIDYLDTELTEVFYGDGTTQEFLLPYVPKLNTATTRANNGWNRVHEIDNTVTDIPETYGQADDIEVFVAGKRLNKAPCTVYNPDKNQLSPAGDSGIPADYSVDGTAKVRLTVPPALGAKVIVKRKQGVIWQNRGESLADTENAIGKFLRAQTVSFPK